jgi:hypothetical protein
MHLGAVLGALAVTVVASVSGRFSHALDDEISAGCCTAGAAVRPAVGQTPTQSKQ